MSSPACQLAHLLAQAGLRSLCRVLLPLGRLGDRGQVAALAGQQQPGDPEQQVSLSATVPGTDATPRSASRRHFSAASGHPWPARRPAAMAASSASATRVLAGNPGSSSWTGGSLPVQVQAGPVGGERPGGLRVPDRLHRVPVPGQPVRGGPPALLRVRTLRRVRLTL
jgi:hypothetical protein